MRVAPNIFSNLSSKRPAEHESAQEPKRHRISIVFKPEPEPKDSALDNDAIPEDVQLLAITSDDTAIDCNPAPATAA